nr:unnamed protein product [uncultured bacterium]
MQFQSYKIADLIPASYNPRKKLKPGDKEYEKIKNSIKEFGYVEPIIINSDMTIIGGHQRATVLADLGYTEVECIVVDIDKTKEKALNVALNKITGEWNKELLADLIKDLEDSDFDVGITGFEPPEIEQLFNSVHDKKITEDDFDVEAELAKSTVAKTGDVWLLGKHRVICGDSILPETYDKLMDGQKANLVLTDPPYNVNVEETAGKIKNDNMPDEDFYKFLFAAFVNMEQSMEQDASIYVFHADTEGLNFRKAFKDAGFYLSGCCICGNPITQPKTGRPRRFCCEKCRREWWKAHPEAVKKSEKASYTLVCEQCGKPFISYGNKNRKYCGRECYFRHRFLAEEDMEDAVSEL